MSSSEDYSAEGSSDVNDQKVNKTSRKLSSVDGPGIFLSFSNNSFNTYLMSWIHYFSTIPLYKTC